MCAIPITKVVKMDSKIEVQKASKPIIISRIQANIATNVGIRHKT